MTQRPRTSSTASGPITSAGVGDGCGRPLPYMKPVRLILPAGALSVPSMVVTPSSVMLPPGSTDSVASDGIESWCAPLIEIEPSEALDKTSENSGKTPLASCGVQVEAVAKLKLPRP